MSGSHGHRYGREGWGITSLTIKTNEATYGPFGSLQSSDTEFNYWFGTENQFGGFHGSSSSSIITSIGVYVHPIHELASLSKKTELSIS